jgi:arabinosyltransferase
MHSAWCIISICVTGIIWLLNAEFRDQRVMTWQKVFLVDSIVEWSFRIIVSDIDVVWMKDPLPTIPAKTEADVIFSHDGVWSTSQNVMGPVDFVFDAIDVHGGAHLNLNTGLYIIYPTRRSAAFVHAWAAAFPNSTEHDQNEAYRLLRLGNMDVPHPQNKLVRSAYNERLWVGVVPSYILANGHTYMVSQLHKVGMLCLIK